MEHLRFGIVETVGIPRGMAAPFAGMEILIFSAVKTAQSLNFIAHCVGVDQVDNHPQAEAVGDVNEFLEFLRRAETG